MKVHYKGEVYVHRALTFLDSRQFILCRAVDFNWCSTSLFNENGLRARLTAQPLEYKKMRRRDDDTDSRRPLGRVGGSLGPSEQRR